MTAFRWVLGILAVIALAAVALRQGYRDWLARVTQQASADSRIVRTARGFVEYDDRGDGDVVLHFHGGNVGHNGWFFLEHLVRAGYRLITPDRPGYLGTPIGNGGSPAEQADLAAALLDTLKVHRVAVVGVSAGGPGAIEFAARHPDRIAALVLLSAVSQRTGLSDEQTDSALGRLVMTPQNQDFVYFLINRAMHAQPARSMRDFVKTETTYDAATGDRYIAQVLADPAQKRQMLAMADAMVPALPRFAGVMNDLEVQTNLEELPFAFVRAPTLVVGSRHDGDIGYANAVNAHERIAGSTLKTVDQFGHVIWWGDPEVTRDIESTIEAHLERHLRQS